RHRWWRALAARAPGAAQIRHAGERHRAGIAEPRAAGPHLCHRAASCRQQDADRRHHARRALADPADRAVPAVHPRDLLRPDHALVVRSGGTLSHRGAGRAEERAMSTQNAITRALTSSPLIAVTLYVAVTGGLLLMAGLSVADVVAHRQAISQTSDLLD